MASAVAELDEWVKTNGIVKSSVRKVLLLGNSGVGKSFLCNTLLGAERFTHAFVATSVTRQLEYEFAFVDVADDAAEPVPVVIFNIPGMMEANEQLIPENIQAIKAAFAVLPEAQTQILFVMTESGGRLISEQLEMFRQIFKYVEFDEGATGIIINQVRAEEFSAEYAFDLTSLLHQLLKCKCRVWFQQKIKRADRENPESDAYKQTGVNLTQALLLLHSYVVKRLPGGELMLAADAVAAEIAQLKAEQERTAAHNALLKKSAEEAYARHVEALRLQQEQDRKRHEERLKRLRERRPRVVHHHGGGGGGGGGCVAM
jgi:energy-coupling factor transporter ATP-binding protein EcfA2